MQNILDRPEQVLSIMRDVAADEILPCFNKLNAADISEKKPGDLVTIADKASEEALRKRLSALLPGSVLIGEEDFESNPKSLQRVAGEAPVWIVDPVDGPITLRTENPRSRSLLRCSRVVKRKPAGLSTLWR